MQYTKGDNSFLRAFRLFLSDLTPPISNIYYPSLAVGFLLMSILSAKPFQLMSIARGRYSLMNVITKYFLDPFVLQVVSLGLLIYFAYRYFTHLSSFSRRAIGIFVSVFFPAVMVLQFAAEQVLLKPSFHYERPTDFAEESVVVSFLFTSLGRLLGVELDAEGTTAPSGFTMRQTIILLFFLSLSHQKCVFRAKAATDSERNRPPIPAESGH